MLKSLDILLSFTVVMLAASMAVTVLTQIWTTLCNLRGKHLRDGLVGLLQQLHQSLSPADAQAIVNHILTHPLIHDGGGRLGSFIHRDELVRLLFESAAGEGAHRLPNLVQTSLKEALACCGVSDPAGTLKSIQDVALEIEAANPAITTATRHNLAILHSASSAFVAQINCCFEGTIDRVSARFTLSVRRIAFVNAILVAAIIQMDAVSIINRLASDNAVRGTLIEKAYGQEKLSSMDPHQLTLLAANDIFQIAATPSDWIYSWHPANLPGILLSVLLLSLGAPFWFAALKNILRLRNVVTEGERAERPLRN